jgi:hypothetical protein
MSDVGFVHGLDSVQAVEGVCWKSGIRLGAWVIAIVGASGGISHAQTPTPGAGPQLWTLIVTPLLSGAIGIVAAFFAIRFESRKTTNQELIKKRILVYDAIAPKLNDLLCFFLSRGPWKSLSPPLMIQRKRELDQTMYVYGPLFVQIVFEQYNIFIHLCFKAFTGVGRDACLRANHNRLRKEWGADWKPEWDTHFVAPVEAAENQHIMREYDKLLALLAAEIGARRRPVRTKEEKHRWWDRMLHKSCRPCENFAGTDSSAANRALESRHDAHHRP